MEKTDIKTSVIIPVYNVKDYLKECVESALSQTQKEIEIILVDDGSTDGSSDMIRSYEERYSFIKAIYQSNQKLGAARNAGIKAASGRYIYFLDADDYISEDLLEKCYQASEAATLDFLMFDAHTIVEGDIAELREGSTEENRDRSGLKIEGKIYSGMEYWNTFFPKGGVYSNAYLFYINAEFLRNNQLYFEPGFFYEDMDWMVRMYACAERVICLAQKFYFRRIRKGSIMTVQFNDMHVRSGIFVCKKLIRMALAEEDMSKRGASFSILEIMMVLLQEIIESYCVRECPKYVENEVWEFCQYVCLVYMDIGEKDEETQIKTFKMLEKTKKLFSAERQKLLNERLKEYRRNIVTEELRRIPLNKTDKVVGIYGTGILCERFLTIYQRLIGEISAAVFFIDTYKKSKEHYQQYTLYNISDIAKLHPDSILIASNRYKDEMLEKVRQHCSEEPAIFFLPEYMNALFSELEENEVSNQEEV